PVHGDRTRLACCRARLNAQHPRVACYRFAIELIGATGCMSRSMTLDSLAQRAARILTDAGSAQRIDVALRNAFAQYRRWTAEEKHAIARAVFATGRWQGWLRERDALPARVLHALQLQERFEHDPAAIKPEALAARAIPAWAQAEADFSPEDLRALQSEPVLWLRARHDRVAAVRRALGDTARAPAPAAATGLRYTGPHDLFRSAAFHSGLFEIQDLGSQLVGHACAPQPGETWWDACAGEG